MHAREQSRLAAVESSCDRDTCLTSSSTWPQGAGKWFPRMLQWADRQWRWRNPYTGHVMRYFDDTDIVTQLPDAFNFKPYWCAPAFSAGCRASKGQPRSNRCIAAMVSSRTHG